MPWQPGWLATNKIPSLRIQWTLQSKGLIAYKIKITSLSLWMLPCLFIVHLLSCINWAQSPAGPKKDYKPSISSAIINSTGIVCEDFGEFNLWYLFPAFLGLYLVLQETASCLGPNSHLPTSQATHFTSLWMMPKWWTYAKALAKLPVAPRPCCWLSWGKMGTCSSWIWTCLGFGKKNNITTSSFTSFPKSGYENFYLKKQKQNIPSISLPNLSGQVKWGKTIPKKSQLTFHFCVFKSMSVSLAGEII